MVVRLVVVVVLLVVVVVLLLLLLLVVPVVGGVWLMIYQFVTYDLPVVSYDLPVLLLMIYPLFFWGGGSIFLQKEVFLHFWGFETLH